MPAVYRLGAIGASTFVGAAGTQAGISAGKALVKNMDVNNMVKDSPHCQPNLDRAPSPDSNFVIQSPLEKWEFLIDGKSPLEVLLASIFQLNISVSLLIFILLYLIFIRYIYSSNKELIWRSIHYILIKIKTRKEIIERLKIMMDKGENLNNRFMFLFFIFICVLLFIFIILNLFFLSELKTNIDSYVVVYNFIYDKCGILK